MKLHHIFESFDELPILHKRKMLVKQRETIRYSLMMLTQKIKGILINNKNIMAGYFPTPTDKTTLNVAHMTKNGWEIIQVPVDEVITFPLVVAAGWQVSFSFPFNAYKQIVIYKTDPNGKMLAKKLMALSSRAFALNQMATNINVKLKTKNYD